MKRTLQIFLVAICLAGCSGTETSENFTAYVDPKIGSGGHGHVFVGANVPFGMVQLGPTSIPQDWDWCSGYHDSDSTVIGFSHTHLSGTGIGDLFDITVMPVTGDSLTYARGRESDPESGLWSYADRTREICHPGYYSVPLSRYGITAELTTTERVGMHRYTFPESENAGIVFDLVNGGCWDRMTDASIEVIDSTSIRGYRYSKGWADDQRIFYYAEFSKPFKSLHKHSKDYIPQYAKADFETEEGETILLKVALSPVSMEGAYENMMAELPGWDFDATARDADRKWNEELSKIKVETDEKQVLKIFYTALYHSMIAPVLFCDTDGSYRGADGKIYPDPGYKTYSIFSLWDTYRAAMPLYTIFQEEKYVEFINTMLAIFKEQGELPVWHLHGCETYCMVGNPGIPPVADAIVKNITGFDYGLAFEAMKTSALKPDRGQGHRMKYGYIPCDLFNESVAYDLEYALADAALANAAEVLGKEEDSHYFMNRSKSYKFLYDPDLRFIRGKDSNGEFRKDYNPFFSSHRADDYCEGNGWQYTWLVPQDFEGLVDCFGSQDLFIEKLDSLFTVPSIIEGEDVSPDISGLIGQYAHGNEPSHHILYLYTMAGQPWKTADRVREVLSSQYTVNPDGLSGNEDVGQMSAWYIMSALGFYEVEPASGRYWFGSPLFDKVEIEVPGGSFTIVAEGNSEVNRYIREVSLNGERWSKGYIEHKDIVKGGNLTFEMGPEPESWYQD